MRIQLLYFNGCPNWQVTAERLEHIAEERGVTVERVLVEDEQSANRWRFRGSPTVLIDGVDPFDDGQTAYGLACRVYTTPDGLAGSPTVEQLIEAVDTF